MFLSQFFDACPVGSHTPVLHTLSFITRGWHKRPISVSSTKGLSHAAPHIIKWKMCKPEVIPVLFFIFRTFGVVYMSNSYRPRRPGSTVSWLSGCCWQVWYGRLDEGSARPYTTSQTHKEGRRYSMHSVLALHDSKSLRPRVLSDWFL